MILRFHGGSDDTFGEYGHFRDDYDNCASGEPIDWVVTDRSGQGVMVTGQYGRTNACWSIAVTPYGNDDDEPVLPPWPMRFEPATANECVYSPTLIIEAPEGVTIKCLQAGLDGAP